MFFDNNPFGEKIFRLRYAFDENETWEEACRRVANHVAQAEVPANVKRWSDEFYEELVAGRFMPGGRIWYGSGRNKAQLINCFVLPCEDSREGWGKLLHDTTVISGTGGGVGTNFFKVRYRGAAIAGTGGESTGSVSIMRMVNAVGEEIKGGGGRRAAYMFCLPISHPDIMEFLNAKLSATRLPKAQIDALEQMGFEVPDELKRGELNNANISVVFDDESPEEFFEKVRADTDHELVWKGQVVRSVKARELWNLIIENALKNGEPGVLNGHFANEMNNLHYYKRLESTNPCVTADTWVTTDKGPRQVRELIGKPFNAMVNGKPYFSPVGFVETGTKGVLRLKTKQGHELKLTQNHKVLVVTKQTRDKQYTEWVEARHLQPGDQVVLHDHRAAGSAVNENDSLFKRGWLLGSLHGDGNLSEGTARLDYWGTSKLEMLERAVRFIKSELSARADLAGCVQPQHDRCRVTSTGLAELAISYGMSNGCKGLTDAIESSGLVAGFLRGWFDADGSVQGNLMTGASVRLSSVDLVSLRAAQRALLRLGVSSTIYPRRGEGVRKMPDGKGGSASYFCQSQHELVIANDNLEVFEKSVGFFEPAKAKRLGELLKSYVRRFNRERFLAEVESLNWCDFAEPVYDCAVPGPEAFDANGLYVHNCGEIWMQPYSVCCLGAVVLSRFVKLDSKAKNPTDRIDWGALHETVSKGVRFLDNVLSVTHYPIPEVEIESKATRRIGLGIMGLADMLAMLGLRYTSDEALSVVDRVMQFIKHASYDTSTYLAVEKGPFEKYDRDEFLKSGFVKTLKPSVKSKIKANGIRNCALNTTAPTGTTSIVQGVWGSLEPFIAPAWKRNYMNPDKSVASETMVLPLFAQFVREGRDVSHFEGADEVSPERHFEMQAVCQKHVDNAISKTINIPQGRYTNEMLSELYMRYLPVLKGVTVYPEGSREFTPLERIPNEQGVAHVLSDGATEALEDDCPSGICGI